MWFLTNPALLRTEIEGIEGLAETAPWLKKVSTHTAPGFAVGVSFDIEVDGELKPFVLEYPAQFPATPPSIKPRDGKRYSEHQYGDGGELCLEWRADNWDPTVTGAMMIGSVWRLLSGEVAAPDRPAAVPSAHFQTEGQKLRGADFRFILTPGLKAIVGSLEQGKIYKARIGETHITDGAWIAHVEGIEFAPGEAGHDPSLPAWQSLLSDGVLRRLDGAGGIAASREALEQAFFGDDPDRLAPQEREAVRWFILTDGASLFAHWTVNGPEGWRVWTYRTVDMSTNETRLPARHEMLATKKVGVVGCGSLGSKIAAMLVRAGVRNLVLVDGDVFKLGNLVRHELDATTIGEHKAKALRERLRALAPKVQVTARSGLLGGQESSGYTAVVMDDLATCDLIVDATADAQCFNFSASAALTARRIFIWAEVYAGGIGGFVARLRPDREPPPHAARNQYLAWCRERGVPWLADGTAYEARHGEDAPLIADDADVSLIGAHATRMGIDALTKVESAFGHPAYAIGLAASWIFREPLDIWPLDFSPESVWPDVQPAPASEDDINYVLNVLGLSRDAD